MAELTPSLPSSSCPCPHPLPSNLCCPEPPSLSCAYIRLLPCCCAPHDCAREGGTSRAENLKRERESCGGELQGPYAPCPRICRHGPRYTVVRLERERESLGRTYPRRAQEGAERQKGREIIETWEKHREDRYGPVGAWIVCSVCTRSRG
jgi:hypothetical protein